MLSLPIHWIEQAIRINSVTYQSNHEMVRFLRPLLEESGLKVEEQTIRENGTEFTNLLAFSHTNGTEKDLLALNTHTDTVSPGASKDWTKTNGDPFAATRVRDRIYGLGSADVKIDFLCKIWAARQAKPWPRPFVLVGTYGEERGLIGISQLFSAKKIKPRHALVGEPSNLELIYAHKGHLIFTLEIDLGNHKSGLTQKTWRGTAAHSSTPHLGENAIRKALQDIQKRGVGVAHLEGGTDSNRIPDQCTGQLIEMQTEPTKKLIALLRHLDEWERELRKRRDTRFTPSFNTLSLNLARMDGETLCLTFDIRILPDTAPTKLKERVMALEKLGCRIRELTVDPPLRGQKNGPFMEVAARALKSSGVKVVRKTKASSTEAALYSENGAEAIVFGPGVSIGNVHKPNEHNSIRQIGAAIRFYTEVLKTPLKDY